MLLMSVSVKSAFVLVKSLAHACFPTFMVRVDQFFYQVFNDKFVSHYPYQVLMCVFVTKDSKETIYVAATILTSALRG